MSKFLSIECNECHDKSIVFGNASSKVVCKCGKSLLTPTGGKANINSKILEVLS